MHLNANYDIFCKVDLFDKRQTLFETYYNVVKNIQCFMCEFFK